MNTKFAKKDVEDIFELNEIQKGILYQSLKEAEENVYNVQLTFSVRGPFDVNILREAFALVQAGNEALRSGFSWERTSKPLQIVMRRHPLEFRYDDLSRLEAGEGHARAEEFLLRDRAAKFDLGRPPVCVRVIKLSPAEHWVTLANHHILYDGWSTGILLRELFHYYRELRGGGEGVILSKASYKEFRLALAKSVRPQEADTYWREYLSGYEITPFALGRHSAPDGKGGNQKIRFSSSGPELESFARANKVTKAAVIYAAFGLLLQRYTNAGDIVFGTVVSSRNAGIRGNEEVVGNFINTLPLRLRDVDDMALSEVVRVVHQAGAERSRFHYSSYFDVKQVLGLTPAEELIDCLVAIENYPLNKDMTAGLGLDVTLRSVYENTGIPLVLTVFFGEDLEMELSWRDHVFDNCGAIAFSNHLINLLQTIIRHPETIVRSFSLLSESEKNWLLYDSNNTRTPYPAERTLASLFEEQVLTRSECVAVVKGDDRLSYAALNARANHVAALLLAQGIVRQELVAVLADRSLESVIAILGIVKAGGAYLPLDTEYPPERLEYLLRESKVRVVLSMDRYVSLIPAGIYYIDLEKENRCRWGDGFGIGAAEDLAYVMYTSGSSGRPKGVMITQRNVIRLVKDTNYATLDENTCILQSGAPTFDATTFEIWGSLLNGGCLCLVDKPVLLDTMLLGMALRRHGVNTMYLTAPLFNHHVRNEVRMFDPLQWLILGGEALSPRDVNLLRKANRDIHIVNGYGPTENTTFSVCYDIDREYPYNIPIGTPIGNSTAYIVDRLGLLQAPGLIGELYVGGDGVARGYQNDEGLTAAKFVRHAELPEAKVYRTGDLARWLSGKIIEYCGRADNQVKIRGFRIELAEVESHLLAYPGIRRCVAVVHTDDDNRYLAAYYVSDTVVGEEQLNAFLTARLPVYMVPLFYIRLEAIPMTLNGKVDHRSLPRPERGAGEELVRAANPVEEKLVEIWAGILQIDKGQIGVTRSFFSMGGHSLRAAVLVNRIFRELQVELPLKDIFKYQTVRSQAIAMKGAETSVWEGIPVCPQREEYAATNAQRRLYFLHEMDPDSLAYNMPYVLRIKGPVDRERFNLVFRQLLGRHGSLRTTLGLKDGRVLQKIASSIQFDLDYYEPEGKAEDAIREVVRPFRLTSAPLMRAGLIRSGDDEHLLVIDLHHIIFDGVSKNIFIRDFCAFYRREDPDTLPVQYKDYAEWQQLGAQKDRAAAQRAFWLSQFAILPPLLDLPVDRPRPVVRTYGGGILSFQVDATLTARLKAIAGEEDATIFMVLLSVYTILLGKLSGQDDIVVGTPAAMRHHADTDKIIGLFANTLPLRNHPSGGTSFRSFLRGVRDNSIACFDRQEYPYEELLDELKPERDTGRNPLFDAFFIFENFEDAGVVLPGLWCESYDYVHPYTKFDLTLSGQESGGELRLQLEYATDLFDGSTAAAFAAYFQRIAAAVAADKNVLLADIRLLSPEEEFRLLTEFNATAGDYAADATVVTLFERQAARTPDRTAVRFAGQDISYATLNERANSYAHLLIDEYSVGAGTLVGIMMDRSEKMVIALLAVLKAGGAYVPLDPAYPAERLEYILTDSGAGLLVVQSTAAKITGAHFGGVAVVLFSGMTPSADVSNPVPVSKPADPCYVIYTSGSTGRPKGVMIPHGHVVNFMAGVTGGVDAGEDEVMLAVTSTSFDISVLELFWTLTSGREVVLHESDITLSGLDRYIPGQEHTLDFSLFFFSSYDHTSPQKYHLLLEAVKYADDKGFKAVWTPERHFHEFGGLFPNPAVTSAALAMITHQIELRSGSVVSPLHDELRIAEEWSVVDNLSGGRVGLSFASGWNPDDFVLSPGNYGNRFEVMFEQIAAVRRIWKGEKMLKRNGAGRETEVGIFPRPIRQDLPVWVTSAGSPATFKKAGETGANVLTHFLGQDIEMIAANIRLYREARKAAGYDRGQVVVMVHTYLGDDVEEVERLVKRPFLDYLKSSIALSRSIFEKAGFKEEDLTEELKSNILENSFKRYYRSGSLIGTPESCAVFAGKLKAIGVDEIACLVDFGIDEEHVLGGLKRLSDLREKYAVPQGGRKVTMLQSTPSYLKLLSEDPGSQQFLASLRILLIGGEALPPSLIRTIRRHNRTVKIYNMYGPTETTVWSCMYAFGEKEERVFIGRPMLNTRVYILDGDLHPVPSGIAGNLYIGGKGVSPGYWRQPELTALRFIDDPWAPGEKMYHTGDIARWTAGGQIEYLGRSDDQLKIRGFRIEPEEIERNLRMYGHISDAVVVVRTGQDGEKKLVAYVVSDKEPGDIALRTFLAKKLPYYAIPAQFVRLPRLPLTPNGKLDKKSLPEPAPLAVAGYVEPETQVEKDLADVWAGVLGLGKVGMMDNFFFTGGDSIKSIQIISRMQTLGYRIRIRDIFTTQTVRELASRVQLAMEGSDQSVITGMVPLSPIQRWFFDGPVANKRHYNQSVLLEFPVFVAPEDVRLIFAKVQDHHDSLRMVFTDTKGGITGQYRGTDLPVSLEVYARERFGPEEFAGHCSSIQASMDLGNGPLIKLGLFDGHHGSRLLIVVHHLVIDGISWRILFEDIERLYRQLQKGEILSLPPKTDSFKLWMDRLHRYRQTAAFRKGAAYWQRTLAKEAGRIPKDQPQGSHRSGDVRTSILRLDEQYTAKLLNKVHEAFGTRVNDILLAALWLAVREIYGIGSVRVDMEGHGREDIGGDIDVSRTIGWFTNIYSVLLEGGDGDAAATVKQVKETLRAIPNGGIDYLLTDGRDRDRRGSIFFNYLGQFDTDVAERSYTVTFDNTGDRLSPEEKIEYDLEILGLLINGTLELRIGYSGQQYTIATVERLSASYGRHLEALIDVCCEPLVHLKTPSDLTYKGLSIAQLDELQTAYAIEDVCTLSPLQEGMLFHYLLDMDSEGYFLQMTYRFSGPLEMAGLEQSLDELVQRYQVLRTIFFHDRYDRPVQVILKEREVDLLYVDVRPEIAAGSSDAVVDAYRERDKRKKFNPGRDNLLRLTVLQVGPHEFEFIWSYHHIIMDGWCLGVLIDDFREIYAKHTSGMARSLPAVRQYSQYIGWLQDLDKDVSVAYWKNYLAGYENLTVMPSRSGWQVEKQRPTHGSLNIRVDRDMTSALKRVSAECGVTLNTVFQALWGILLARYNDTTDVVFGTVVSGRPAELDGIESMVGLFINTIPVRVRFDPGESLPELLRQLQEKAIEGERHHYSPLSEIQGVSAAGRELIDHILVFENFPISDRIVGEFSNGAESYTISDVRVLDRNNYDLTLVIFPGEEISVMIDYNPDRYDGAMMQRALGHLTTIMEQIVQDQDVRIGNIDLLTASEQRRILEQFNDTTHPLPSDETVVSLFERQVEQEPENVALVMGARRVSYRELNQRANAVAYQIMARPPAIRGKIGLLFHPGVAMIAAVLGVLKAGCAYVPLSADDPLERCRYMLSNSGSGLLLSTAALTEKAEAVLTGSEELLLIDDKVNCGEYPNPGVRISPEDPFCLIYTSGTGGWPKAVDVPHRGLYNYSRWRIDQHKLVSRDVSIQLLFYGFDAWGTNVYPVLAAGAALVILDEKERMAPAAIARAIVDAGVTCGTMTPAIYNMVLEEIGTGQFPTRLRLISIGGEKVREELLRKSLSVLPATILCNEYGPTETTITVTHCELINAGRFVCGDVIPIGKPIYNSRIYILDRNGHLQPVGIAGELCVSGQGVAHGYLNDTAMTQKKFVPNLRMGGGHLYKTGDLARWLPDGQIEFLGRIDSQVKIRGFRIELGEIERQLDAHPEIERSLVLADNERGGDFLVAWYTGPREIPWQDIIAHLQRRLPDHMIPAHFIHLAAFPLTANGKIDQKALPVFAHTEGAVFIAPVGEVERKMAEIWAEVLEMDQGLIGADKNFFELGGHSLKAITLINKLKQHFGVELSLADIFEKETIAQLADYLLTIGVSGGRSNADGQKMEVTL